MKKSLIAEVVYREGQETPAQQEAERKLVLAGMRLYKKLYEYRVGPMSRSEKERHETVLQQLKEQGYRFQAVELGEAAEAYRLLQARIDRFDMRGFHQLRWEWLCENKFAVCVYSPSGEMCAVLILPRGFHRGLTVVADAFRGLGLGKAINFYRLHIVSNACNAYIWSASDNYINQHVMQTMGGRDTMRRAKQYVTE